MRYEDYAPPLEHTCECENAFARPDGSKNCGVSAYKMFEGRYMCRGHFDLFQQKAESMANCRKEMAASKVKIVEQNDGRDWARRIIARSEAGEQVPAIALQMAEQVRRDMEAWKQKGAA